jgi:glycine dehydrogenase subunit 1
MTNRGYKYHPYIPNSVPNVQEEMLKEIGLKSIEDLHEDIPEDLTLKGEMNIPAPFKSEYELKRHLEGVLNKNKTCTEYVNFLGGGCWQHYVPAVCDEINTRAEFLTAYGGEPYEDHGRFQALFEYQSLVAELVDMDVVNVPTIDWGQATATAIRMASRINGRGEVIVPRTICPDRLMIIQNYCSPDIKCVFVDYNEITGQMDIEDLKAKISSNTTAVYFENPSFLGFIEGQGEEISKIAHKIGAECIVGVDPISLGVLEAPVNYGADIVCGDLQPLGIHMNYGGGQSGFIATRDEEKYVMEYPSRLFGITPTTVEGEYGFGDVAYDRTSFAKREGGKEYVGTQTALWGITSGVFLSLVGPKGIWEIGQTIMQNSQYAINKLSEIKNVNGSLFNSCNFKEFIVDFNATGKSVEDINKELLDKKIFGGIDLSNTFKELGQVSLYSVTEVHSKEDIDNLVKAIKEILEP